MFQRDLNGFLCYFLDKIKLLELLKVYHLFTLYCGGCGFGLFFQRLPVRGLFRGLCWIHLKVFSYSNLLKLGSLYRHSRYLLSSKVVVGIRFNVLNCKVQDRVPGRHL